MADAITLLLAGLAGAALGALFFGGLWWTVRTLWFAGSMLVRSGLALVGFYFVSGGRWDRLLACVLGFTLARAVAARLVQPTRASGPPPGKEASHAPQPR
jgi:F1F0 ATPase subunit 2